jgi:hypothetical protein
VKWRFALDQLFIEKGGYSMPSSQTTGAGGETVHQQISFTLSLDKASYQFSATSPAHMEATLIFFSTVSPPVVLEFFSLQHFEIIIINDNGDQVFQWSAGRAFPQIASNIPVTGEVKWDVDVALVDNLTANKGKALPAGRYIAQSFLVNHTDLGTRNPPAFSKKYAANLQFTIGD